MVKKKIFIIWHGLRQGNDGAVYTRDKKTPVQRVSVHRVREKHVQQRKNISKTAETFLCNFRQRRYASFSYSAHTIEVKLK